MKYTFAPYKKSHIIRNRLNLGSSNPSGERIDVNSLYIERGGKPWIGVMGEYHFVRDSSEAWYDELCKMKAGGITVVATYMFWIYHEETEGEFDFTGDRDIRRFVLDAQRAGLDVLLRIGPWAHGECRNGGFPYWLINSPFPLRQNDPDYLARVKILYEKIYEQVKGLMYSDGGNIIGIQLENELVDNAEHLLTLKRLAVDIGFNVPIYTVTGWNSKYGAEIPVNDVLPVFAAYADAPWADTIERLPLSPHYVFDPTRNDAAVGMDLIKETDENGWRLPYERYPFATCELGSGLIPTHHRRPIISGMDAYAMSLVKLGSGNNLVGYYMYHGGVNKIGKYSTLNENRASGYPNDYAILSYDYHTALTSYGEAREQYGLLNILHLFINDFGEQLAAMEYVPSENKVVPNDLCSLRYAMRSNGKSGFVFVNHYQRLARTEDISDVEIAACGVKFPAVDVCGDVSFIMPFNLEMSGNTLEYATAQLLCRIDNTYFFAEIGGITPQYKLNGNVYTISAGGTREIDGTRIATISWEDAKYARKLSDGLYIGDKCSVYESNGQIKAIENGSYSYRKWNGRAFERHFTEIDFTNAEVKFEEVDQPFEPEYPEELCIGSERRLTWKRITVSSADGYVEIPDICDTEQIYADGRLVADEFYFGESWRVPAKLLFEKECYLVTSEFKDDFYREF